MSFFTYRDKLFEAAEFSPSCPNESWRNLQSLSAELLRKYLGFDEINLSPEDDVSCPFDLWGISHSTLYLIKLDDECFDRDEEILGFEEVHEVLEGLVNFVRKASEVSGVSDLHTTRAIVAELISKLAHGEHDETIERIKIVPFLFNPVSGECSRESSLRFNMLKCNAQTMSLYSVWQEGIQIPLLDKPKAKEKVSVEEVESPNETSKVITEDSYGSIYANTLQNETGPSSATAYKDSLIAEAQLAKGLFAYNLFDEITSTLCEIGEYEEINQAHSHNRNYANRPFAIDGWSMDETNNVLTLFLLDSDISDDSFTKSDLDKLARRLINFASFSLKGLLSDTILDLSTEEGSLSYRLEKMHKKEETELHRIECVILTLRPKAFKQNKEDLECEGIDCRVQVLDYQDLYQLTEVTRNTQLEINFMDSQFGGKPVQMISAVDRPDIGYKAYVGKMRADVLASIYEEYGQKVLSSNVRAFLLTGGKVNKGIQKTIKEEPDNFFAFNNGICVVASDIKADDRSGITLMASATDFQIVNGGQTTASLHYAKKHRIPINKIFVPLKLSVVPSNIDSFDRQVFVQNISRYANSQNKVSDSDLGTNTQFQIKFQKCAENSTIFSNDGNVCKWYYERARGTYRIEKIRTKSTASSKNVSFLRKYPQKFDKTELAKWFKAWSNEPHISNVGGQKCFIDFSRDLIEKEKKDGLDFCSTEFFKYAVGKGILYRHIDQLVYYSSWYQAERSYKVNIVGYTMALLRLVIDEMFPGYELNFLRIWREQQIPTKDDKVKYFDPLSNSFSKTLDPILDALARYCRSIFDDDRRTVSDVGEWVKKSACWKMMIQEIPDFEDYREDLRPLCCPTVPDFVIKSWREK